MPHLSMEEEKHSTNVQDRKIAFAQNVHGQSSVWLTMPSAAYVADDTSCLGYAIVLPEKLLKLVGMVLIMLVDAQNERRHRLSNQRSHAVRIVEISR